jgi:SSS family transporter
MELQTLDWVIIVAFFGVLLTIGYLASRGAGKSAASFFLSGRNMPWWLLGVSMVATTFSADTPNLVTDMVRTDGVAANWLWWAFLLTGMLTVFVYAKLWNRSKVLTDNEFYEIRYSGKPAEFLRVFRGVYLGLFFNVFVIATVCLAFIKIIGVMMGVNTTIALIIASVIVLFYAGLGGLKSILWTDLFQFSFALFGAIIAAVYSVNSPQIGSLSELFTHPEVQDQLNLLPSLNNTTVFVGVFLIPIAVQWWAAWYPGAEPGGGGYVVQRMLSAKSEKHATGATLLFNFFHYAIRPWPWIIVGLASIIVYPDLQSLSDAFPDIKTQYVQNDMAYPAMLQRVLPAGLLGLVVASLIAAFMSTVASQLNWGSSYLVNDFYGRVINKNATEKQRVLFGRLSTVVLMIIAVLLTLVLENALQVFRYLLMIGAGTGLIYILRWFWWRINAYSEISAMAAAMLFSVFFIILENNAQILAGGEKIEILGIAMKQTYWDNFKFILIVVLVTITWITVSYTARSTNKEKLRSFYRKIKPGGPGWKAVVEGAREEGVELEKEKDKRWDVPTGILCMILGSISIYSILFSVGMYLYGNIQNGIIFTATFIISGILLMKYWRQLKEL